MKYLKYIFLPVMVLTLISCKKYLDVKSNSVLSTISNLDDIQSLLDYSMNVNQNTVDCFDNSCDDYYMYQSTFNSFSGDPTQRQYTWENSNLFYLMSAGQDNDWSVAYSHVYTANTVLESLEKINLGTDQVRKKDIQGQGYFLRGYTFLQLIWAWGKGYNGASSSSDLGIPLRLTTNYNKAIARSSVQEAYRQVLSDLKNAAGLLPVNIGSPHPTRPGRAAAYGALARTYLSMRDYANCLAYADSSLKLKSDLIDYNSKDVTSPAPFDNFESEVIYSSVGFPSLIGSWVKIDSILARAYSSNDLRKSLYFQLNDDGTYGSKGNYAQFFGFFTGLAVDEMLLMRAECNARLGNVVKAMDDLNLLLKKRFVDGTYIPISISDPQEALRVILSERRKELIFRGLRWMDLKRLNLEGANITLKRFINNKAYTLLPNSPRYAMPIPEEVIALSGLQQNPY